MCCLQLFAVAVYYGLLFCCLVCTIEVFGLTRAVLLQLVVFVVCCLFVLYLGFCLFVNLVISFCFRVFVLAGSFLYCCFVLG